MGCYTFAGAIVCAPTEHSRRKVEDLDCACGSTWGVVTSYEWYDPTVECWYCGRRWSGADGEALPRVDVTLAMRARRGDDLGLHERGDREGATDKNGGDREKT